MGPKLFFLCIGYLLVLIVPSDCKKAIIGKPGSCPLFLTIFNPCPPDSFERQIIGCCPIDAPEGCDDDSDCSGGKKCCSTSCKRECLDPELIHINKPGKCPASPPGLITPCIARCSGDRSCKGNQKCCSRGCELACMDPVVQNPKFCPPIKLGPPIDCRFVKCKTCDANSCPEGKVCCKVNNCCSDCVDPVNTDRPGSCPAVPLALLKGKKCHHCEEEECQGDASCPDGQKCCRDGCCMRCTDIAPVAKPGFCPRGDPDLFTICLVECQGDDQCPGDSKCCSDACHVHCMSPIAKGGTCPARKPVEPENCAAVLCATCRDEDCPGNQICCRSGCCDRCTKPVLTTPPTKPVDNGAPLFIRPGKCPAAKPVIDCSLVDCPRDTCSFDSECLEGQKCCSTGCCTQCVTASPFTNKSGECPILQPGTIGTCVEECGDDRECESDKKCCSNGCGHTCQAPRTKPGKCAAKPYTVPDICEERCQHDTDCSGNDKCCANRCGHQCQPPEKEIPVYPTKKTTLATTNQTSTSKKPGHQWAKPGYCPLPSGDVGICANLCGRDRECEGGLKCCRTSCGGTLCTQPVEKYDGWWKAL